MLVFDRTHKLKDDRDWAPRELREWFLPPPREAYAEKTGGGAWLLVLLLPLALVPILGDLLGLAFTSGSEDPFPTYDRSATYDDPRERDRLPALEASAVDFGQLAAIEPRQLVQVRGRIVAEGTLDGLPGRAVARRLALRVRKGWWIHEAVVGFELEDDHGRRIEIRPSNARILAVLGSPVVRTTSSLALSALPAWLRSRLHDQVKCAERLLEAGQHVTLYGYRAELEGGDGYRDSPQRIALIGGSTLPLLIVV